MSKDSVLREQSAKEEIVQGRIEHAWLILRKESWFFISNDPPQVITMLLLLKHNNTQSSNSQT